FNQTIVFEILVTGSEGDVPDLAIDIGCLCKNLRTASSKKEAQYARRGATNTLLSSESLVHQFLISKLVQLVWSGSPDFRVGLRLARGQWASCFSRQGTNSQSVVRARRLERLPLAGISQN